MNGKKTSKKDKRTCEWGTASNIWIRDYLINKQRLLKFTNRHGDSLKTYFFQIINSLVFYQRWKNWRLGSENLDTKGYIYNFFFNERMQPKEIAELLEVSEVNVRNHLGKFLPSKEQKFKIMQENYNRYLKEEAKNGK